LTFSTNLNVFLTFLLRIFPYSTETAPLLGAFCTIEQIRKGPGNKSPPGHSCVAPTAAVTGGDRENALVPFAADAEEDVIVRPLSTVEYTSVGHELMMLI